MNTKAEDFQTIPQLINNINDTYNSPNMLNYPINGKWISFSTGDFLNTIKFLSLAFNELKLKRKERVGIIAESSPYWVMMDLAIVIAGGITVPIFSNISKEHMNYQIKNSKMRYIFLDSPATTKRILPLKRHFKKIITLHKNKDKSEKKLINYDQLIKSGKLLSQKKPALFDKLCSKIKENDIFTIIYTSGSTGVPKGVELTNKNIISQVYSIKDRIKMSSSDVCVSSLPLAHIFERTISYFYISQGAQIYFSDSLKNVGNIIREIKPTIITVVPRLMDAVFIKMKTKIESKKSLGNLLAKKAFDVACNSPIDKGVSGILSPIYKTLVYKKLNKALGGNLRLVVSGGAALSDKISRFFNNIGINLMEGYGLTETSPVLATNAPQLFKSGTVGKPLKNITIKISKKGEILAKGPNIMKGYHKKRSETKKAIDKSGWFHTGDLGSIDKDGYLSIKGRVKELFKTTSGKYITPVPLENLLNEIDIVDISIIIADNKKFVSALLFLNNENLKKLQSAGGNSNLKISAFLKSETLYKYIHKKINDINQHLDNWSQIKKFICITDKLSIENGEITPSMKLRRHIIEEKFSKKINDLYSK